MSNCFRLSEIFILHHCNVSYKYSCSHSRQRTAATLLRESFCVSERFTKNVKQLTFLSLMMIKPPYNHSSCRTRNFPPLTTGISALLSLNQHNLLLLSTICYYSAQSAHT